MMTFDKAHEGDTAVWCTRTFGLRPPESWSEPVTVTAVVDTYYGQEVTISTGETLTSGLHAMAIVKCPTWEAERAAAWLAAEVEAGRACGDHERPLPCIECA